MVYKIKLYLARNTLRIFANEFPFSNENLNSVCLCRSTAESRISINPYIDIFITIDVSRTSKVKTFCYQKNTNLVGWKEHIP